MIGQETPTSNANAAVESLAALQQLALEAGLSENLKQLVFRILNRSIVYCRYDRAALWQFRGKRANLLGVSGSSDVNRLAALTVEWRRAVQALPDREKATVIGPGAQPLDADLWEPLQRRTNGLSILWLPIIVDGRPVAGLWLERWGGARFTDADRTMLEPLALSYGIAWRSVARPRSAVAGLLRQRKGLIAAACLAALALLLCFVQVPLRIVAPCEVVPADPLAITAPLNGVLEDVPVLPGRAVEAGALLARYDQRVAREELKVAQQQVQIIESDLQRARVQAFDRPTARAEIALLENRLRQERTRLELAEHRMTRLEIRAPSAGTLMFADPNEWRGRPVQVGERLMLIVDPARTKLRIWLPEKDNIAFDTERPLTVVLDADPGRSRTATLLYVANHSQISPDGLACFRAEADWRDAPAGLKLGLEGSAVLYGEDVPLGYWLLRRPLAAARRWLGV
jgi:multidrug resistance efflux pump